MHPGAALAAVVATGFLLASCSSAGNTEKATTSPVAISVTACGSGWTASKAGAQVITVRNTDSRPGEAQLIDSHTGAVYADVEPLGPGTTDRVRVSLSAGSYAWRCIMEDEAAITGSAVTLTGRARGTTPGVVPVSQADLVPATQAYQRHVSGQLPRLRTLTDRLRADITSGRLARARRDWLPAHLEYERLGAAYDAFGDLDGAINGLPNGLPDGVRDAKWTGFHRIEYGLWHGQSSTALQPCADILATQISALQRQFATAEIDPLQISIRAHEISENALQFELTGQTDFGSRSELDTVRANLEGTTAVLRIIHSLLAPRYPQLPQVTQQIAAAERDIDQHAGRERIDADISRLCELLAPVAAILEPRRTS